MSFSQSQAWAVKVGNTACYLIDFYRLDERGMVSGEPILSVGTATHVTAIEASLPANLAAGRYVFNISGLSDEDYALIQPADTQFIACRLYLFWGDAVSWDWQQIGDSIVSYLANAVGSNTGISDDEKSSALVAELSVLRVKRQRGELRYETVIEAAELVARRLSQVRVGTQADATDYKSAVQTICDLAGVSPTIYPQTGDMTVGRGESAGSETYQFTPGHSCGQSLLEIAGRVETNRNRHGRGLLLIRNGALHVGLRPIPLQGDGPYDLTASTGLLAVSPDDTSASDPFASVTFETTATPERASIERVRYTVTLKGRPDIKPGHAVRFDPPVPQSGTLGSVGDTILGAFAGTVLESDSLSANPVTAYVQTVVHKQSITVGFVTTLSVISAPSLTETDVWDVRSEIPAPTAPPAGSVSGDAATRAASAIRSAAAARTSRLGLEVGEIRENVASGTSEPPAQTETAWLGIVEDGRPNGARRIDISRVIRAEKSGVAYASPFFWGKAGLILPRYPGMRVIVGFRNGNPEDAIDLGAIPKTGLANQEAQAGDYWLSLPANVEGASREHIDNDAQPSSFEDYTDVVSQDLIDADGNRVIETAEFTVRVSEKSSLRTAGTRPDLADDQNSVTIEHTKEGAKIVIKADGSILISGTKITLDAGSGDIELKAANVDVQVSGEMNVH